LFEGSGFRIAGYFVQEIIGMGTFYVRCKIENTVDRNKSAVIPRLLVDTGSEYTWVSATVLEKIGIDREKKDLPFVMANGQQITRSVGFAIIRLDKFFTIDEVVFAEKGDLLLLGARTLEGLNLSVDSKRKKLVAAGPLPAARTKGVA
jgi:predicted aspartyl protease